MSAVEPSDIDPEILRRMRDVEVSIGGEFHLLPSYAARVAQQIRNEAVRAERERCLAVAVDELEGTGLMFGVADRIKAGAPS